MAIAAGKREVWAVRRGDWIWLKLIAGRAGLVWGERGGLVNMLVAGVGVDFFGSRNSLVLLAFELASHGAVWLASAVMALVDAEVASG